MTRDNHLNRFSLPIVERAHVGLTTYDAKDPDTSYPPIVPLVPPESAPNVLLILLDDVGFGASSTFGGPCRTPTADRLAAGGLRYNRFTPPHCAHRRARRCLRAATTTRCESGTTVTSDYSARDSRFAGKINWV